MQKRMTGKCAPSIGLERPSLILDRLGVEALRQRLYAFGQEAAWSSCYKLFLQVVAVKPYGGYYLSWDSQEELEMFCEEEGISTEMMVFLYKANLFDYPGGGVRGVISVRPGYEGRLLLLREFGSAHRSTQYADMGD